MSKKKKIPINEEEVTMGETVTEEENNGPATEEEAKAPEAVDGAQEETAVDEVDKLGQEVERLTLELAEAKKEALRAHADADNYKKRLTREKEEIQKYAGQAVIEAILPALDHLAQALFSAENDEENFKALVRGVEMIEFQFQDVLAGQGLEKIDPTGQPFDPETSEALGTLTTDEVEEGMVTAVFMPGYRYKGRIIRHAKVQVSHKPAPEAQKDDTPAKEETTSPEE